MNEQIIKFIETAAGFLAPPFIIIFPALLLIQMYKNKEKDISKGQMIFAWVMLIVVGGGSYICVVVNLFLGKK